MITEQRLKEYVHRLVDAENAGDWDKVGQLLDESISSDYIGHLPGARDAVRGINELKQWFRHVVAAIPGFHSTTEDIFIVGDKVAARSTARRTDPATGKTQRATVLMVRRLKDGKFAEDWQVAGPWQNDA